MESGNSRRYSLCLKVAHRDHCERPIVAIVSILVAEPYRAIGMNARMAVAYTLPALLFVLARSFLFNEERHRDIW